MPNLGRKRKGKGKERIAFSYDAVRTSKVLGAVVLEPLPKFEGLQSQNPARAEENSSSSRRSGNTTPSLRVEFGSYPLPSLEICEMGSRDERGGYKSVGGISLLPPRRNL